MYVYNICISIYIYIYIYIYRYIERERERERWPRSWTSRRGRRRPTRGTRPGPTRPDDVLYSNQLVNNYVI